VPIARQSYLGNLTQVKGGGVEKYWTESEAYRLLGGSKPADFEIGGGAGPGSHHAQGAGDRHSRKEREMVVSTADGEPHECDDVVLAVPPSVWKDRFFPLLPPGLRPQMGSAVKYLATVKEAYWAGKPIRPMATPIWKSAQTWDATEKQGAGRGECCAPFRAGRWPIGRGRSLHAIATDDMA
jgi:monoamine oxidase